MNKNTTRHLSFGGHAAVVIRGVAASVIALAALGAASARTVEIAAIQNGQATLRFGDADGNAYTLAWGYGPADGGASTNAWAHFGTLGAVAAGATSASIPLPAGWGDTATHLRFFLLEPQIPAAATRVEYVEATGTQWIDTGVNLCSNDTVVAEYEYPDPIVGKNNYLFGVYKQGMTAGYFYSNNGSYPLRFQKANGTSGATTTEAGVNATPDARQTVTMKIGSGVSSSIVSASGGTLYSGVLGGTIRQDATAPLALFTANISGSPSSSYTSAAKIYSFRIYDKDDALRLDFVPCTVNGTPAMFDRVSGNYLYNGGTGSFTTGATMATPLLVAASSATASAANYGEPDAYLDYVEATGTQSVLLEGCIIGPGYRLVAEYTYPDPIRRKSNCLFGVYKLGATAGFYYSNNESVPFNFWRGTGTGNTSTATGVSATPGERQTVVMDLGSGTSSIYAADGRKVWSGSLNGSITANSTSAISLFTATGTTGYESVAKIHSFRIYGGDGSLAHHFLPCRKDDVVALFDKQTGRIVYPQGGALVAGPVLPRPVELVDWIQSDGADGDRQLYIDTEIVGKAGVGMVAEMEWVAKPTADSAFCGALSSAGKRVTLYTSAGTHQMGYDSWNAQIQGGGNAANAGVRFRVTSSLAGGAQYLNVKALDGSGYDGTRTYNTAAAVDTERTLYLFARNDAGTPNQLAKVRLYSLVLTNDLGVVRDFIPCVADNGQAGLYDRVSERVFFPQAAVANATAAFDSASEIGAVTNTLIAVPEPQTRLRYIESDGARDFVNLGVIGKDGVKMVAEMEWATLDTPATFCGAAAGTSSLFTTYRISTSDGQVMQRMGYANGSRPINSGTISPVAGTRYRVTTTLEAGEQHLLVEKKKDGVWTRSGSTDRTDAGPMDTGLPLTLFARNLNGVPDEFAAARVYSLQLWQKDGGEWRLVRDMLPARLESGAVVLWDKVSATPFHNAARYGFAATGAESVWRAGFIIKFR